ncbi:MAG: YkgJ family cysteine cluster protein [Desulfobacterium sp.]|nr:YkgJ family cysteine cluster protein [Desulfobacterium sp.]MBU3947958.1 YkgJ family cysteine cluster protein [Pseudomonadota bacterium]MBU4010257.1 YkgJ family cysteine cluster protein [Pseudomonadota bacterium]MBU4036813.1 YkgJ family cysteine cluster protein [Pseudomonadota bacterium]
MEENILQLFPGDKFRFTCKSSLSCFNECCRDLNQFLYPYDILRLKNNLGLSSGMFLEQYTNFHTGPETGLPVVSLKTDNDLELKCPFVTPSGCKVYKDRPSSCRTYPLSRLISRSRETGRLSEYHMLFREPHCLGFDNGKEQTAHEWIKDQDIELYNEMNDMMMEIISLKNQNMPGELDIKSSYMFRMALYDLDAFRTYLFSVENMINYIDENDLKAAKQNDTELLKIALKWVKKEIFSTQ